MPRPTPIARKTKLELNQQFQQALDVLENSPAHVFITGRAGTGKSTLLEYFCQQTKQKAVVVAPTGVAALNVAGQTIHSFFGLAPNVTIAEAKREAKLASKHANRLKLFKNLQLLIIDEISMVRADLLDSINAFLQTIRRDNSPFGGVRLVCFGDLYQLPPVARGQELRDLQQLYESIYFFSSRVWLELQSATPNQLVFIELEKIYRQTEQSFIEFLNSIRDKTITDKQLAGLNQRVLPDLNLDNLPELAIVLTATNNQAEQINLSKLAELTTVEATFTATVRGHFERSSFPTDENLQLKVGARVMLVNNDSARRWVNGSMATVVEFIADDDQPLAEPEGVLVRLDDDSLAEVYPFTWEISQAYFDDKKKTIERETKGSFKQIPLRLAWAVTIHKSQGKSFDQVVVDLGRGAFATGQTYVALSRCTNFAGLHLAKPLRKSDVRLDYAVVRFLTNLAYQLADEKQSLRGFLSSATRRASV